MSKAQGTQGRHGDPCLGRHGKTFQLSNRFIGLAARQRRTTYWPRRSLARRPAKSSTASLCGWPRPR